jgi:hypothetical protein
MIENQRIKFAAAALVEVTKNPEYWISVVDQTLPAGKDNLTIFEKLSVAAYSLVDGFESITRKLAATETAQGELNV